MANEPRRQRGFAGRPLALRRELLAILERVDRLTATELASCAFRGRIMLAHPSVCSTAQLNSVRRALRRLIARGHVGVVGYRQRHRLFVLTSRRSFPPLELGALE